MSLRSLEARWASLAPYAAAAGLLTDVLPIASGANAKTLREHTLRVAVYPEAELAEERPCFIDGCPADWAGLPIPSGRIVIGLDGGYVRNWEDRKTNFEVIVGRSVPEDRDARYVGLVHGYDPKPKRRLFDTLKSQGLQANQDVTFLTDGGEEIRTLTELVTPVSEQVLEWFHITMRLTVLEQYARGLGHHDEAVGRNNRLLPGRRGRAGGGMGEAEPRPGALKQVVIYDNPDSGPLPAGLRPYQHTWPIRIYLAGNIGARRTAAVARSDNCPR